MYEQLKTILELDKPSTKIHTILKNLPELSALMGIEEQMGQNHKDMYVHTMIVLDNVAFRSISLKLRYAALVHDIGKASTKKFGGHHIGWTFHNHQFVGAKMIPEIGKRLGIPKDITEYARKIAELHHRPIESAKKGVTDSAIRRLIFDAGDLLDDLILFCRCDVTTLHPQKRMRFMANFDFLQQRINEVKKKDEKAKFQSPIRGEEIMKIFHLKPGKNVGILKGMIESAILSGDIPNEYEAALEYILQIKYHGDWKLQIKNYLQTN